MTSIQHWLGLAKPKNVNQKPFHQDYMKFFCTDWLTNLLDKCNLMMCNFTNCSSYNACIMVLLFILLCAPFLSQLPHWWRFLVCILWLQCEAWVSEVLARALLMLFFAWNATQCVQHSWKRSVVIYHDRMTLNRWLECVLQWSNISHYPIILNGWIDCRDAFYAILCL